MWALEAVFLELMPTHAEVEASKIAARFVFG